MSENNPYEAPSANLDTPNGGAGDLAVTTIRKLPSSVAMGWYSKGLGYFKANPGIWVLTIIVYFILAIVLQIIPLIGPIALNLINPVFIAGIMLACFAIDNDEPMTVGHLFSGFKIPQTGRLVLAGLLYMALLFGFMLVAGSIGFFMLGGIDGIAAAMGGAGGSLMFWLMFLLMMLFMLLLAMTMWFVPPLIAFGDLPLVKALQTSFKGCTRNMLPFLLYGLIGIGLAILAVIPLGLGFLVLVPVGFASIYVAYKEIFTNSDGRVQA